MAPVHPVAVSVYVTAVSAFVIAALAIAALVWVMDQAWRAFQRHQRRATVRMYVTQRTRRQQWRTHP